MLYLDDRWSGRCVSTRNQTVFVGKQQRIVIFIPVGWRSRGEINVLLIMHDELY